MNKLNTMVSVLVKVIFKVIFSIHIVAYASSAMAEVVLVDLTGSAPEEASITVSVNKPGNATNGLITLDVYDADYPDEGELIINGNTAIKLFGAAGVDSNNNKSASITFSTPASYWRDGNNTLVFRHIKTGGYIIDAVAVQFEVDNTVSSEVTSETPVSTGSFPIDHTGSTPEEASITVSVNKPDNATNGLITLNVYDADYPDEGELIINGNTAIKLFGAAGVNSNNKVSADITFNTPASYWRDGNNTLVFRHIKTGGYIIDAVAVQFEVDNTVSSEVTSETPVSTGSFPIDHTGSTPEEASITVSVNKPDNATNGLITLNVYDADYPDEGELIINGNTAIKLFGAAGVNSNNKVSADITFNTPASYWRDGNNTLVFRHIKTGGYIIDAVAVQFEVDNTVSSEVTSETPVSTGSFPIDHTGSTPEEASITVSVNKPDNATNGLITLNVYDADFPDEGELIINGNTAIKLFGAAGVDSNNNKSASITFSTPASYWRDGNNTLVFRHIKTGGYIIDAVAVQFEVDNTVSSEVTSETPVSTGSFPIDHTGSTPEEASITVSVNKPDNATNGLITLNVYDADYPDEGELIINGNTAIKLFGAAGVNSNNKVSADITFNTPASYWRDGNNTLVFRHIKTGGYIIDAVAVQFEVSATASTEAQASTGSFPIDLYGAAPEEATVTVSVNKPGNATEGLIVLTAYDADNKDEGELIINGNPAVALFGSAATSSNDNKSASIILSTPAAYWRDGNNTLVFRHTRTGGFVIEEMVVLFDVDATVSTAPATEPAPAPETVVDAKSLPIELTGTAPESASLTVSVNKPSNATNGLIKLNVYDADMIDEGELIINGNSAVVLFGSAASSTYNNKSANIVINTPAAYWRDGNNTLVFRHTRTGGFVIDEMVVQFEVNITSSSTAQPGPGAASLSWSAPAERTDGTALSLSEISGYTVYYGTSEGNYSNSINVNDGSATSVIVADLQVGTYYMVMTARDIKGQESAQTSAVIKQIK